MIDTDGRTITSTLLINPDGTKTYEIHYTATIINNSGMMIRPDVIRTLAKDIANQIEKSFSGSDANGSITWSTTADIVVGDQPRADDNTISIEQLPMTGDVQTTGDSQIFGDTQRLDAGLAQSKDFKEIRRTGAHEFGHGAGLIHPQDAEGKDITTDQGNLMQMSTVSKGTTITRQQIVESHEALKAYEQKKKLDEESKKK